MSLSQYVIICKGRIDYATNKDSGAKIRALSDCAAFLLHHIEVTQPGALTEADVKPISDLQHLLMDQAATISVKDLDVRAVEMFNYLDALEDKFDATLIAPEHKTDNGQRGKLGQQIINKSNT